MNKLPNTDILSIEQFIKVISRDSNEQDNFAKFCDILISSKDLTFWFVFNDRITKKEYTLTGAQVGIVFCAIAKYYDNFSWENRSFINSETNNDMCVGKYRLIDKVNKRHLDIPIGFFSITRAQIEQLLADNKLLVPVSWDITIKTKPQERSNVKKLSSLRKSKSFVITEVRSIWDKQSSENDEITMMGEMVDLMRDELVAKCLPRPKNIRTIRNWISDGHKKCQLTIPNKASTAEAPPKTKKSQQNIQKRIPVHNQ